MTKKREFIPIFRPNYDAREIKAVTEVLKSGWIGLGPKTAEFEKRFASYVGAKRAIAFNSGTAALHLALLAANIGKGDEVIVPALTFVSTAHAVMYVGARPVFADVEPDILCLSPEDVARKITTKTRAIIPVHYGGHPCDMKRLRQLTASRGITLIEDAAHACGSVYQGRRIGSISPFTCFSFHAVKNLATGDGGMVTTDDSDADTRLRRLRWVGITKDTWGRLETVLGSRKETRKRYGWYYEVLELGYKCHMNDINAALGLVQLDKLEKANKKRRKLAANYTAELSDLPGVECPTVRPGVLTAQHNYVIRCDRRDELHLYLREQNISSGVHYTPLYLHPFYQKHYPNVHLPVTEEQASRLLLLPLYPQLTKKEQNYIIKTIRKFFGKDRGCTVMDKLKKHCPVISGDNVRLRLLQQEDIEMLRHWRNENRFAFLDSSYISAEMQQKWFKGHQEKEDDLMFIIETLEGKPIGTIALYKIDPSSKQAEFGRLIIDAKSRRKGFARDATESLIRFAFSTLDLQQIRLEVKKNNKPAIGLYEKVEFRRVKATEDGHAPDKIIMMILDRNTYLNLRK